jgi:aerobic-type carbon monoxide dehydrogenase small subunit (CoxS/CutS family)
MPNETIDFNLNGIQTSIKADPKRTLLDVLREDLGLTGTKQGCDNEGLCGSCTVIVDGKARRACRTSIGEICGRRIITRCGLQLQFTSHSTSLHRLWRSPIGFVTV